MNQIINMIIRQVMNQLVRRGINAGFDKAGQMGQRRNSRQMSPDALDDFGNSIPPKPTQEERRQARHAQQQARQANQAIKLMRRVK